MDTAEASFLQYLDTVGWATERISIREKPTLFPLPSQNPIIFCLI